MQRVVKQIIAYFLLAVSVLALPRFLCAQQSSFAHLPTRHVRDLILNGKSLPLGPLLDEKPLQISLMLPIRDQAGLDAFLMQLNDAGNQNYHQFLSPTQFADRFGPAKSDYEAAVNWAHQNGFSVGEAPANRMVVPLTGSVAQVNNAFHVKMMYYQHPTENRTFYSPDREPTLDPTVRLWHISNLDNYSLPKPNLNRVNSEESAASPAAGSGPGGLFLPFDMRTAYYGGTSLTGSGQSVGIFSFDGFNVSDIVLTLNGSPSAKASATNVFGSTYQISFTQNGASYSPEVSLISIDGSSVTPSKTIPNYEDAEAESVLDVSQAIGMAPGLSYTYVYIAPYGSDGTDAINKMASDDTAAQLSCSWSWSAADPSTLDPIFQEMSAQGQNFFAASGDFGSWPNSLREYYPQEDAHVTAVGGTNLSVNSTGGSWALESAWSGSSGGVSPDHIPLPSWQSGFANAQNGASTAYRNVPDISMDGGPNNYACYFGSCESFEGTSFAAPRWAGFLALVNEQAAQIELVQPAIGIGFINPTLYSIAAGSSYRNDFHDIVSGNDGNYNAVTNFDLVTGLGTPTGQSLIDALAPQGVRAYAPVVSYVTNPPGPYACGNPAAGYHNPCYLSHTVTITTASNSEVLYVNGYATGSPYTITIQEDWGTAGCYVAGPYGYQCFGYSDQNPIAVYAKQTNEQNSYSEIVQ